MSPAQAYAVASQWGSYMHSGDPGAVFYTLHANDGRPITEAHRQALMDYALHCSKVLMGVQAVTELTEEERADLQDLHDLRQFFAAAPLREG